jgi:cyclophilin family peptidyl-prolyl cis-trans isomerase
VQRLRNLLLTLFGGFVIAMAANPGAASALDPENALLIQLDGGPVTVELLPEVAPQHVARIKELTREGFYDGIVFHRVIDGFMAQTGDPTGTGRGGSSKPNLPAEFSNTPFERGTIGMARTQDPNSANSQFFITFARTSHLDGQYTVWGRVVDGMEHVDAITRGEPPRNPDAMLSVRVLADVDN